MDKPKQTQKDGKYSRVHVGIPTPLYTRLTKAADERMVGMALLVTKAIEQLLDRLDGPSQIGSPTAGDPRRSGPTVGPAELDQA